MGGSGDENSRDSSPVNVPAGSEITRKVSSGSMLGEVNNDSGFNYDDLDITEDSETVVLQFPGTLTPSQGTGSARRRVSLMEQLSGQKELLTPVKEEKDEDEALKLKVSLALEMQFDILDLEIKGTGGEANKVSGAPLSQIDSSRPVANEKGVVEKRYTFEEAAKAIAEVTKKPLRSTLLQNGVEKHLLDVLKSGYKNEGSAVEFTHIQQTLMRIGHRNDAVEVEKRLDSGKRR